MFLDPYNNLLSANYEAKRLGIFQTPARPRLFSYGDSMDTSTYTVRIRYVRIRPVRMRTGTLQ